jgi:hypothetical protein
MNLHLEEIGCQVTQNRPPEIVEGLSRWSRISPSSDSGE